MIGLHPDILALIPSFLEVYDIRVIKNKLITSNYEYEYFANCGHLNIIIWQWNKHSSWNDYIGEYAARNGHINVIEWMIEKQFWYNIQGVCYTAAQNGHLNILQLLKHKCVVDNTCLLHAVTGGHLHILIWAHANNYSWNMPDCLEAAIDNKHQDIVNWILAN